VAVRLSLLHAVADLPPELDLLVKAVPEVPGVKLEVLTAAERAAGPGTVLATNTSSLSVTELASALLDSARFLGLHFFNPVPASIWSGSWWHRRPRLRSSMLSGVGTGESPTCPETYGFEWPASARATR
jgi:hypothetical protein